MNWLQAMTNIAALNHSCVLVTVVESEGSAPRTIGTRMVVTLDDFHDTIGGGALELEAINHARAELIAGPGDPVISYRTFVLGNDLTQCCGGRVKLQFDFHWANDFQLHIFGAGHVAQEVARIVQRLPCIATFHDQRTDWLSRLANSVVGESAVSMRARVDTRLLSENVFGDVEACAPGSYYLIMTHSHELDLELVEAVLSRNDARYCGLIASRSKARKFISRLKRKGFSESELCGLTAPMGCHFKTGNTPMEVALAAMADVIHLRQMALSDNDSAAVVMEPAEELAAS
jgi:xanthine dehydrogenase accessory factor